MGCSINETPKGNIYGHSGSNVYIVWPWCPHRLRCMRKPTIWPFWNCSKMAREMAVCNFLISMCLLCGRQQVDTNIGSRPSDYYFRSVCLSVCLCRVFLSRLWSDFDQTRTYVICLGVVVSPRMQKSKLHSLTIYVRGFSITTQHRMQLRVYKSGQNHALGTEFYNKPLS